MKRYCNKCRQCDAYKHILVSVNVFQSFCDMHKLNGLSRRNNVWAQIKFKMPLEFSVLALSLSRRIDFPFKIMRCFCYNANRVPKCWMMMMSRKTLCGILFEKLIINVIARHIAWLGTAQLHHNLWAGWKCKIFVVIFDNDWNRNVVMSIRE